MASTSDLQASCKSMCCGYIIRRIKTANSHSSTFICLKYLFPMWCDHLQDSFYISAMQTIKWLNEKQCYMTCGSYSFDAQPSYVVRTGLELFEIKDSSRTGLDIPGSWVCRAHPSEYWGYSYLNYVFLLYSTWRLMREGCGGWIHHKDVFPIFLPCIFLNSRKAVWNQWIWTD